MSHRKVQKQEAQGITQAALEKRQGRNRFRRIAPLAAGAMILFLVGYALRQAKKEEKMALFQQSAVEQVTQGMTKSRMQKLDFGKVTLDISEQKEVGVIVWRAIEAVMSAKKAPNDPVRTYLAAHDSLNATKLITPAKLAGRQVTIPEMSNFIGPQKPDLEYFIVRNNSGQGNAVLISYDSRLVALAQFLDVLVGGDGMKLSLSNIGVSFLSFSKDMKLVPGITDAYTSYSTEEVFRRKAGACVDAGTMVASLLYAIGQNPIPAFSWGYVKTKSEVGSNFRVQSLEDAHFVVLCSKTNNDQNIRVIDPVSAQILPVHEFMTTSRYKTIVQDSIQSQFGQNQGLQEAYLAIELCPTSDKLEPKVAGLLRQNKEIAKSYIRERFNLQNKRAGESFNQTHDAEKTLMETGYLSIRYEITRKAASNQR